jgi:hypothetical protein
MAEVEDFQPAEEFLYSFCWPSAFKQWEQTAKGRRTGQGFRVSFELIDL